VEHEATVARDRRYLSNVRIEKMPPRAIRMKIRLPLEVGRDIGGVSEDDESPNPDLGLMSRIAPRLQSIHSKPPTKSTQSLRIAFGHFGNAFRLSTTTNVMTNGRPAMASRMLNETRVALTLRLNFCQSKVSRHLHKPTPPRVYVCTTRFDAWKKVLPTESSC
jgi:hypothetical protein